VTVGTTISAINLTANGATTAFAYPFLIPQASDVLVRYTPVGGSLTILSPTQYQITGVGNPNGGTIIYPLSGAPLAAGSSVIIARILPLIQATSVSAQGPTFAAIESALDYEMLCLQQLQTEINELFALTSSTSTTVAFVSSVQNVAALGGYTGPFTQPLYLLGYYTTQDGGEGMLLPQPDGGTVNNGTIFADGLGRTWYRATGDEPYSLKWFGAKGDAVTDDTAAISATFAAARYAIYAPSGTYVHSAGFSSTTSLRVFGDGIALSVFSPSVAAITFTFTASTPVTIESLQITYPTSSFALGVYAISLGISATASIASRIRDVAIDNATAGVFIDTEAEFIMDGCFITGFSNTAALISASADVNVTNCSFYANTASTVSSAINWQGSGGARFAGNWVSGAQAGFLMQYSSTATFGNVVLTENSFISVDGPGIELTRNNGGSLNSLVMSNNVFRNSIGGISVPHDGIGAWITSMNMIGNAYQGQGTTGDFGFEIDSIDNFNLSANAIDSATTSTKGIVIGRSCSMAVIQGNNLAGSFAQSISVSPAATMIRVLDNQGYNPVGSSTLSPAVSPWSYTASISPQTLYLSATTSINAVTYNGTSLLPVATGAGVNFTVDLGPNETVIVSYSGAMTANVMTH
jgi:hypothetical protein